MQLINSDPDKEQSVALQVFSEVAADGTHGGFICDDPAESWLKTSDILAEFCMFIDELFGLAMLDPTDIFFRRLLFRIDIINIKLINYKDKLGIYSEKAGVFDKSGYIKGQIRAVDTVRVYKRTDQGSGQNQGI